MRKFRSVSIGQGIQNLGTVATPALLFLLLSIPAVPRREFRTGGQGQHPQDHVVFQDFSMVNSPGICSNIFFYVERGLEHVLFFHLYWEFHHPN